MDIASGALLGASAPASALRRGFVGGDDRANQLVANDVFGVNFTCAMPSTPSSSLAASASPDVWPFGRSTWDGSP